MGSAHLRRHYRRQRRFLGGDLQLIISPIWEVGTTQATTLRTWLSNPTAASTSGCRSGRF
jgi:hypothetical protein